MSFISRFFGGLPSTVKDPILGDLKRGEADWTGVISWDHSQPQFSLTIYREREVPSQVDRNTYEAIARDYAALRPDLQRVLFGLWNTARRFSREAPDFGDSLGLWSRLVLQGMGVYPDNHVGLIYGFSSETDPPGAFLVSVKGRTVTPLEYVE